MHAGDIDDDPGSFPLAQVGEGALGAVESPNQVGGEDGFEIGAGGLVGGALGLPGRIVDEDVDPVHLLEEPTEHGVHGVLTGEVSLDHDRFVPGVVLPDALLGGLRALQAPEVVDAHPGAFRRKANGDGLTDARTGPGDENALVFNSDHRGRV